MSAEEAEAPALHHAPFSWRNWRAANASAPRYSAYEIRLFSDACFTDEARGYGPYDFLNPVPATPASGPFGLKPALVLRVSHHLAGERPDMSVTQDEHYHGGWLPDELAALASLALGVRIHAGQVDREWGYDGDPLGRARTYSADFEPRLPASARGIQIPQVRRSCDLGGLARLKMYPALPAGSATALVKSARLYQQALWNADASPELAWLLLVSAVETAALQWRTDAEIPSTRLRTSHPEIADLLTKAGGDELVGQVAAHLAPLLGATGRFVSFVATFAPEPPEVRPAHQRFDFSRASIRKAANRIYAYRSRALHGGTPFPAPMCEPPGRFAQEPPEEVPGGLATGTLGATWLLKDTPMLLHTFAYIARSALVNWWDAMAATATTGYGAPVSEGSLEASADGGSGTKLNSSAAS